MFDRLEVKVLSNLMEVTHYAYFIDGSRFTVHA